MRTKRAYSIVLTAAGFILAVGIWVATRPPEVRVNPDAGRGAPVRASRIRVSEESYPVSRAVTGRVAPKLESTLASRISGWVRKVSVEEGDRVRTGQLLVALDESDLRARLRQAQARRDNAALRLERIRELFRSGSATRQQLEDAEQNDRVADAETRDAEAQLAYARVTAPFDGIVTEKRIEAGELVSPGAPLIRLEDDSTRRLEAHVPESEVGALSVGLPVTVAIEALGGMELSGTVAQILPAADAATHSFLVKVDLPPEPGLRSGLFGRLIFSSGTRKGLLVPETAVRFQEGLARVYVVGPDGRITSRLVKPGRTVDHRVEILSGLSPGETLLEDAARGREGAIVAASGDPGDAR